MSDLISEVLKSNELRMDEDYSYSIEGGNVTINQPSLDLQNQTMKVAKSLNPSLDLSGMGSAIAEGVSTGVDAVTGVAKGVPIGLSNFAKEFNKTFLPGYEENVVPFLQENIPGLKSLNNFVSDIFEYKNKAQEIGGGFIGEPLGEFGVTGGAIGGVAKSVGIGNRFLANVLGYGTAEVIAVPVEEQGLLSMGIDYLAPDSQITTAILESLKSDEDQSIFMQKLQKAPENFFVGGVVGEQLDKAVRGVGTLYKYIKNSPKLESIKQELKGGISNLGNTAREFLDKDGGGTTLGSTDIPRIVAEGTKALDEMVNKPQGPELIGSTGELGFYSKALEETKKIKQNKGSGEQFKQMLLKNGVSKDEIEWAGLDIILNKKKVTKAEIEEQLRNNNLEIREVVKDKMPEETRMSWEQPYRTSINYRKSADELKEGEKISSTSSNVRPENLMTPEEVFGSNYIDERADELFNDKRVLDPENYTIEQARADALAEFYDDPFVRIEDENTGMVILGNDSTGYSIYPDIQSTKGEGAIKNAFKSGEIYSLSEAKVQAQQIAQDEGLMGFGDEGMVRFSDDSYRLGGGENYREFVITSNKSQEGVPYSGDHFEEENIIGHFRTSDRETMNGARVLYIDEIQSDWGQKGRDKGFKKSEEEMQVISQKRKEAQALVDKYTEQVKKTGKDLEGKELDEANEASNYLSETQEFVLASISRLWWKLSNDRKVIKGPFVENTPKWTDLMVKRILAKAVEEGYDMVSFSPGYIQNMRWREKDLLKYYDDILVKRVTKIVDKLDDTAFGAGNEQMGMVQPNRKRDGFGRFPFIHLDDMDLDAIKERALNDTKHYDFTKDQVLQPFTVRITNKLKEGVKKGQSLFALPVVAGTTAMTMEGDDG